MKIKIGLFIIFAVVAAAIIFRINSIPDPLPEDIIGVWHSDSPGYKDRYFELSDAIMVFGQGGRHLDIQFITRIKVKKIRGGLTQYTIHHKDNFGFEQQTVFFIKRAEVNTLWFNNQEYVTWQKFKLS